MTKIKCKWCGLIVEKYYTSKQKYTTEHEEVCIEHQVIAERKAKKEGWLITDE